VLSLVEVAEVRDMSDITNWPQAFTAVGCAICLAAVLIVIFWQASL